ncbi:MAG: YggT family protein [Actinobacteria bacterium]|nr:YggT family protein [Actinomycetota bacterium]
MVALILQIYGYVIFARLLLSWFPNPPEGLRPVYRFLFQVTEPALRLVRGLIPPIRIGMMAMDLSPILIFVALQLIGAAIC